MLLVALVVVGAPPGAATAQEPAAVPFDPNTLVPLGQERTDDPRLDNRQRYETCLGWARADAERALRDARAWEVNGGGNAARHCAGAALFELGAYRRAAHTFGDLAQEAERYDPALAARLYVQAGESWIQAQDTAQTDRSARAGLALAERDPVTSADLLAILAHARARQFDYWGAADALSQALDLTPDRAELWRLRAAAHRLAGVADLALDDVRRGLDLAPGDPGLLLERGLLHRRNDARAAAIADFQAVLATAPEDAAAQVAHAQLLELGVVPEISPPVAVPPG